MIFLARADKGQMRLSDTYLTSVESWATRYGAKRHQDAKAPVSALKYDHIGDIQISYKLCSFVDDLQYSARVLNKRGGAVVPRTIRRDDNGCKPSEVIGLLSRSYRVPHKVRPPNTRVNQP